MTLYPQLRVTKAATRLAKALAQTGDNHEYCK